MQDLLQKRENFAQERTKAWKSGIKYAEEASLFEKAYKCAFSERLREEEDKGTYSKSNMTKLIDGEENIAEFYSRFKTAEAKSKFFYKLVDMYQRDIKFIDEQIDREWKSQ